MALPGEAEHHENCLDCGAPLELMVLHSPAGFYLGTFCNTDGPHGRESGYFPTTEEAVAALQEWKDGNKVNARDTEFHPGPMVITELDPLGHPNPVLNPPAVEEILQDCFLPEGTEPVSSAMFVSGIVNAFAFDPIKVEGHVEDIKAMLDELPKEFRQDSQEGGWTFLNMCVDKHGNQWTGLHMVQEQLMVLGIAAGWMRYVAPRPMWEIFHGGMPYVVITTERVPYELAGPDDLNTINEARRDQHDHD